MTDGVIKVRFIARLALAGIFLGVTSCDKADVTGGPQAADVDIRIPISDVQVEPGASTADGLLPLEVKLTRATTGQVVHLDSIVIQPAAGEMHSQAHLSVAPGGEDFVLTAAAQNSSSLPVSFGPATVHIMPGASNSLIVVLHSGWTGVKRMDHDPYSLALAPGEAGTIQVTTRDSLGVPTSASITFTSGDASIATVDASGHVTAGTMPGRTAIRMIVAGTTLQDTLVVAVTHPEDRFVDIAAGFRGVCGMKSSGDVYCWGQFSKAPVKQTGIPAMKNIFGGEATFCGISTTGETWCWQKSPEKQWMVADGNSFTQITNSDSGFGVCGVTTQHEIYCWPGPGSTTRLQTSMSAFAAAGSDRAFCALSGTGVPFCRNIDYNTADSLEPLKTGTFTSIAGDNRSSMCGIKSGGGVACWGSFESSWGGNSYYVNLSPCNALTCDSPTTLAGGSMLASSITAGENFFCALATDGAAYCWGSNDAYTLGTGDRGPQLCSDFSCAQQPVRVRTQYKFRKLSASSLHVCGLTLDGQVLCWGEAGASPGAATRDKAPTPITGERQ